MGGAGQFHIESGITPQIEHALGQRGWQGTDQQTRIPVSYGVSQSWNVVTNRRHSEGIGLYYYQAPSFTYRSQQQDVGIRNLTMLFVSCQSPQKPDVIEHT
jgi:hypothetical protein